MTKTSTNKLTGDEPYRERMFNFIIDVVCAYYKTDKSSFEIKTRKPEIMRIKHYCVHFCNKNIKTGSTELGNFFGYNHANVIHILKKLSGYLEWDDDLIKEFSEIQAIIKHKSIELNQKISSEDYYYLDLDNVSSFKINEKKFVILSGFTKEETDEFMFNNRIQTSEVEHKSTGLYIFETRKQANGSSTGNKS
jgi:hypothetical protein